MMKKKIDRKHVNGQNISLFLNVSLFLKINFDEEVRKKILKTRNY